jgi:ATP-dependent Clp protease protease subunit
MKNSYVKEDFLPADDKIQLKFLENSTHYLSGDIEEDNIKKAIQWIMYENMCDYEKDKQLKLYINSMGGELYQAFALIDIMGTSKYPIVTIATGSIMSAAFLIFASGTKGQRYISPNTGAMCHQFSDYMESKYHDIKAAMKEAEYCNERMMNILRVATGLESRMIKSKLLGPSDAYFTPQELIELNIADHILN